MSITTRGWKRAKTWRIYIRHWLEWGGPVQCSHLYVGENDSASCYVVRNPGSAPSRLKSSPLTEGSPLLYKTLKLAMMGNICDFLNICWLGPPFLSARFQEVCIYISCVMTARHSSAIEVHVSAIMIKNKMLAKIAVGKHCSSNSTAPGQAVL